MGCNTFSLLNVVAYSLQKPLELLLATFLVGVGFLADWLGTGFFRVLVWAWFFWFFFSCRPQKTCEICFDFSFLSNCQTGKTTRGRLKNPTHSNQNHAIFSSDSTTNSGFSDTRYLPLTFYQLTLRQVNDCGGFNIPTR